MGNTQASNSQYSNIYQTKEISGNPYLTTSAGNLRYYDKTGSDGRYWIKNSSDITIGTNTNSGKINLQAPSNVNWSITPTATSICFTNNTNSLNSFCLSNQNFGWIAPPIVQSGYVTSSAGTILSTTIYDINGVGTNPILNNVFSFAYQPVTISVWIKLNLTSGNAGIVFGNFNLTNSFNLMFSGKNLRFLWQSTIRTTDVTLNNPFDNNIWYHIVIIKNSSVQLQLYVNNVLKITTSTDSSSGTINLTNFRIGRDTRDPLALGSDGYFKGSIYGLLNYSRILTANEIDAIYNYQKTLKNF